MNDRISKYFQGELSSGERLELLRDSLTDETIRKEMAAFQNISALLQLSEKKIDREEGLKAGELFFRKRKQQKIKRITLWG